MMAMIMSSDYVIGRDREGSYLFIHKIKRNRLFSSEQLIDNSGNIGELTLHFGVGSNTDW